MAKKIKEIEVPDPYKFEAGLTLDGHIFFGTSVDGEDIRYDQLDESQRQIFRQILLQSFTLLDEIEKQISDESEKKIAS